MVSLRTKLIVTVENVVEERKATNLPYYVRLVFRYSRETRMLHKLKWREITIFEKILADKNPYNVPVLNEKTELTDNSCLCARSYLA